jgi:hypothetical protein
MQDDLPNSVQRTVTAVETVLGSSFSFDLLVEFVAAVRMKPVRIEEDQMPIGMTGYCVALQDVDLICTRACLDSTLTRAAKLHELSHLLLGHIPHYSNGTDTPTYATFIQRRDLQRADRRDSAAAYEAPQERDAELLATHLFDSIRQYESSVPDIARYLHG